jgi:hypothetical protein
MVAVDTKDALLNWATTLKPVVTAGVAATAKIRDDAWCACWAFSTKAARSWRSGSAWERAGAALKG